MTVRVGTFVGLTGVDVARDRIWSVATAVGVPWAVSVADAVGETDGLAGCPGVALAAAKPRPGTVMGKVSAVLRLKMMSTSGRIWRQSGITMLWPSPDVRLFEYFGGSNVNCCTGSDLI